MKYYDRAWALYQINRFKEAEVFFHRLIEENPTHGYYWEGLGHCLKMQNKFQEALEMYRIALLFGARGVSFYVYIAECLIKLGQNEGCQKMLELAERKSDDPKKATIALLKKVWST